MAESELEPAGVWCIRLLRLDDGVRLLLALSQSCFPFPAFLLVSFHCFLALFDLELPAGRVSKEGERESLSKQTCHFA